MGQTQSKISAADFFDINLSLIPTVSDSNLIYITDAVSQQIWAWHNDSLYPYKNTADWHDDDLFDHSVSTSQCRGQQQTNPTVYRFWNAAILHLDSSWHASHCIADYVNRMLRVCRLHYVWNEKKTHHIDLDYY